MKEQDCEVISKWAGKEKKRSRLVTVEPVLMLYMSAFVVMFPLTSQYVLSVMNERYNVSEGSTNGNLSSSGGCEDEDTESENYERRQKAQAAAAQLQMAYDLTQGLPSLLVSLFLGSYTDRKGRRLALIIPMFGVIVRCLIFVIQQITSLPLEVTIAATLFDGLSGSSSVLRVTVYAYIADMAHSEEGNRSQKILLTEACYTFFQAGLQVSMGYMIDALGYLWPYVILIGIHFLNLLYTVCLLPESRRRTSNAIKPTRMILESIKTVLKKRSDPQPRFYLWLFFLAFAFLLFGQTAHYNIENVYILNTPICMSSVGVGYFKMLKSLIQSFASILLMQWMLPRTGDCPVVVLSAFSMIGYLLVMAFAVDWWMPYIALLFGFCMRSNLPVGRSVLSKLVTEDEQGGLMSVIYLSEELSGMIGAAIFNNIYAVTLMAFKGTVFICFSVLLGVGIFIIGIFTIFQKRFSAMLKTKNGALVDENQITYF